MLKEIKLYSYYIFGSLIELFFLPILVGACLIAKFFINNKFSIFFGMMHINNLTYVAKAMRLKGYFAQVVPWIIPEHEEDVISYDLNIKKKYPLFYSHFIGQYLLSFWIFVWAIFKFHIFVMPFRSRILDRTAWLKWIEIPLLHLSKKKVILNTYGGDVATPRIKRRTDLKYSLYDGYMSDPQYRVYNEKAIAFNTRILEKQADCIISAIDHVDYLNKVDEYFHLRCIDTYSIFPKYDVCNPIPIFVHAPNHRLVKGTDQIISIIESLNKQDFPCKLRIIEKTSNAELLEIIRVSDAVIDQLLLGTYARLAIEAMALGKPVFCYLRDDLYKFNPIWKECPIINVNPETLENELKRFINSSSEERSLLGKRGREYIEKYHSLDYVGERFHSIIKRVVSE